MALTPTKTTFETGPENKVATVDVYGKVTTKPVNNVKSNSTVNDAANINAYQPASKLDSLFKETIREFQDPNIRLSDTLNRMSNVIKNPKEFANSIGNALLSDTLTSLGYKGSIDGVVNVINNGHPNTTDLLNIIGGVNDDLRVIVGTVEKAINYGDFNSVNGIANFVAELTGNDSLIKTLDIGPQMLMVKTVMNQAFSLRLPEIADILIDSFSNRDEQRKLRLYATYNAAQYSQLKFINRAVGDIDIGSAAIIGMFPDLPNEILKNYTISEEDKNKSLLSLSNELITLLLSLDKECFYYTRNGVRINSFEVMNNASDDAINVLKMNDQTFIHACLAESYKATNITELTLKMRPYTPVNILKL